MFGWVVHCGYHMASIRRGWRHKAVTAITSEPDDMNGPGTTPCHPPGNRTSATRTHTLLGRPKFIIAAALTTIIIHDPSSAQVNASPNIVVDEGIAASNRTAAAPAVSPTATTLTGDWGGGRTWLKGHGITIAPRLTQFLQGLVSGDAEHGFDYGAKADLLLNTDLSKIGLWNGLSMTVHAEYNFGQSLNGRAGTIASVNTALQFPGMEGAEAFDFSSVYLTQKFGNSTSLALGKINVIDLAASKPFMGGAGIDAFWNIAFAAPPSGTIPPYLLGAILNVRTKPAIFGLWIYDPNSAVNKTGLEEPFNDGVTIRMTVDFPVIIAGRSGHQGVAASYRYGKWHRSDYDQRSISLS